MFSFVNKIFIVIDINFNFNSIIYLTFIFK